MKDKEIIELLKAQMEYERNVSKALIDELHLTINNLNLTIAGLKETIKSLEKALLDKGVETAKAKKALKNVAAMMEKHNERQPVGRQSEPEFTPKEEKPKYDPKTRGNNGAKRLEHMECEERIVMEEPSLSESEIANARFIKYQDSILYRVIPMKVIKEIHRVAIYSLNGTVVKGKAPVTPLLNSNFDGSFIAFCAQMHFVYSMPYNRIASYLNENGFNIGRGTIGALVAKATGTFEKLHECLRQTILNDSYISGDETYHKVRVDEPNANGLKIKKGYVWDLVGHHLNLAYFHYSLGSRAEMVFEQIISGYKGTFQSDALPIYRKLGKGQYEGIRRIPCLQHIKRKFLDIKDIPQAAQILKLFNLLYDREHRHKIGHKGWSIEDNLKWRQEYAPPILEKLKKQLDKVKSDPHIPKDSDLAHAVTYALNEWEWIPEIFTGGDFDLDNNLIERINRIVSPLRRNSLFFGSHDGGETAAVYLSLVVSCRLNRINAMEYISDILNRCASWPPNTSIEKYRDLLPDRWKPYKNNA